MGGLILTGVALACLCPFAFVFIILLGFYVKKQEAENPRKAEAKPATAHMHAEDLVSVLTKWGYSKADARAAVQAAIMNSPESGFEDLLRMALNGNKEN